MHVPIRPGAALLDCLKNYDKEKFFSDLRAGSVVALVALPLGLALSLAVDVSPQHGLFTIVTAGIIAALFGGSRHQVTGPTAAFVVILLPIVHRFGLAGLLYAGFLSGIMMMALSITGFSRIIRMIPFPVVTGFTTGIAVVIFTLQMKDFFGISTSDLPHEYLLKIAAIIHALPTMRWSELLTALSTLFIIFIVRKFFKNSPAPVIGIIGATLIVSLLEKHLPGFHAVTLGERYPGGIPSGFPPLFPFWNIFHDFKTFWSMTISLLPSALTICALGSIESLLSAVVADSMSGTRHDPDTEVFAQGLANLVAPFFGGIAATGAIARTATNIRFGAYSPISSVIHALMVLICLLVGSKLASFLPLAALAALLVFVAYSMADLNHVKTIIKIGRREDQIVLYTCMLTTVIFDMTIGVAVGLLLALILFVQRVIGESQGYWSTTLSEGKALPKSLQLFVLEGPFFFGAVQKAINSLLTVSKDVKIIIIDFKAVPSIDLTALTALYSAVKELRAAGKTCLFCALNPSVKSSMEKFFSYSVGEKIDNWVQFYPDQDSALKKINPLLES